MTELENFNRFLAGIDLAEYRRQYAHIKLVELDLARNIHAIPHLYREYWERRDNFPSYDEFYAIYSQDLKKELRDFRKKKMFSKKTFDLGLPARIYRTWASLLTQIQGGYAAETIYGSGNVRMSAELDYQGVDMRLFTGDGHINVQIKKDTMSREVRKPRQVTKRKIEIIEVVYEVPGCDPVTKTGKESIPFARWRDRWAGRLRRLENGFIIFEPAMFLPDNLEG